MNETLWYYVDRAQQRVGPVTAADVAAAWQAGDATEASLVWREGLSGWLPLADFRAELGLDGEATAAPASVAAPSADPGPTRVVVAAAAPRRSGNGCLVAGLVIGGLLLLAVVAFVVAVGLPAYQGIRDRVEEVSEEVAPDDAGLDEPATDDGLDPAGVDTGPVAVGDVDLHAAIDEARGHQAAVDTFVANTDRCPRDASEIALPAPTTPGVAAIRVGEALSRMCTIEIEFGGPGAEGLAGETVVMSRDSGGAWYCTSGLAGRASLPSDCH